MERLPVWLHVHTFVCVCVAVTLFIIVVGVFFIDSRLCLCSS